MTKPTGGPAGHQTGCPATIFTAATCEPTALPRHQYLALLDQLSSGESVKEGPAIDSLERDDGALSVKVLQEFYVQATRSRRPEPLPHHIAAGLIARVQEITLSILNGALEIKAAKGFSYWGSAIIAAARALGCRELYSEEMTHGREVERVILINPFR
jgi:predicted nucleic acid-binding protein